MTQEESRLYEHRKESLVHALNRNLEWAKRTNEIALQVRRWCIAFCLIFFGFLIKDHPITIRWFHFVIGITGITFFMLLDLLQDYYAELISQHRFTLNKTMHQLPMMSVDELKTVTVLPLGLTAPLTGLKKVRILLSMILHETLLFFYGGLFTLTIGLLFALEYFP